MKFYLGGSIAGGRDYEEALKSVSDSLTSAGHEVLTPFVVDGEINKARFPGLEGKERATAIYDQDLELLQSADAAIFEVSQASHGVGYEIGFIDGIAIAQSLKDKKPTLLLKHESLVGDRHSALLFGNPHVAFKFYTNENIKAFVEEFINGIKVEGRIGKER